jgi:hypothetical protein
MMSSFIVMTRVILYGIMINTTTLSTGDNVSNNYSNESIEKESDHQVLKYYERNNILNGEDDSFFLSKYGVPDHEFVRPRYAFVGEYYIGLEKTYRSTNPEFSNIPIKEMFWRVHDDLNLTCWFHQQDGQWKVFSYIFWPPGAIF